MLTNKIIGYVLLAAGVLLILWVVFQSYQIFTNKASAPILFTVPAPQEKATAKTPAAVEEQLKQQIDNSIKEQLAKILPVDVLPRALNLMSWSIFTGILIFAAGQLASLGIRMVV